MRDARVGAWRVLRALVVMAVVGAGGPVLAQGDDWEQRCVWQCLYNSPGAESRQYQQCVAQMCSAPPAQAQPKAQARGQQRAPAAKSAWTSGRRGEARYAGVEIPGRSFSYLCQRGGPGLIALAGFGARTNGIGIRIDQQAYDLRFVTENGILYTAASSHLLRSLMNGSAVHVMRQGGETASFPLAGSSAAIGKALRGCGLAG